MFSPSSIGSYVWRRISGGGEKGDDEDTPRYGDPGESDEDEVGTDIDNPDKSLSRRSRIQESADKDNSYRDNEKGGPLEQGTAADRRRFESDSGSSFDEFGDAMEHVQQSAGSELMADDERVVPEEIAETSQEFDAELNRSLVDEALDDAFAILDSGGIDLVGANEYAEATRETDEASEDESQQSGPDGNDMGAAGRLESSDEQYVIQAREIVRAIMENVLRILNSEQREEGSIENVTEQNDVRTDETIDAIHMSDDYCLPPGKSEENEYNINEIAEIPDAEIDQSQALPQEEVAQFAVSRTDEFSIPSGELAKDAEKMDNGDSVAADDNLNGVIVTTSVKYGVLESKDVPKAPVVKSALDDETVDYGSDDTPTSSDADTVKDAGVDVAVRERELAENEQTKSDIGSGYNGDDNEQFVDYHERNEPSESCAANFGSEEFPVNGSVEEDDSEGQRHFEDTELKEAYDNSPPLNGFRPTGVDESAADHHENTTNIPRIEIHAADSDKDDAIELGCNDDVKLTSDPSVESSGENGPVSPEKSSTNGVNGHFEISDSVLRNDENQNETKPIGISTKYNESDVDFENQIPEIKLESSVSTDNNAVITPVQTDKDISSHVRSLMSGLTGVTVVNESSDDNVDCEKVCDPRAGVIDLMIEEDACHRCAADTPVVAVSENGDIVKEEVIAPDFARPVKCVSASSIFVTSPSPPNLPVEDIGTIENGTPSKCKGAEIGDGTIKMTTVAVPSTDVHSLLQSMTGEDLPVENVSVENKSCEDNRVCIDDYIVDQPEQNVGPSEGEIPSGPFIEEDVIAPNLAMTVESPVVNFSQVPQIDFRDQTAHSDFHKGLSLSKTVVPSSHLSDLLTSPNGNEYYDVPVVEEGEKDEQGEVRIEDFLLDVLNVPKDEPQHNRSSHNEDDLISEENFISISLPKRSEPDVDLACILAVGGTHSDKSEEDDKCVDENASGDLTVAEAKEENDAILVALSVGNDNAKPSPDINDILSKVPEAPPRNVTIPRFFEEKVEPSDARKQVNGRVHLNKLLKGLEGELSVDVESGESDVSEPSLGKKVITDEMVREAIQYLMQKPFLDSYGMYDSQDRLFFGYQAVFDESLYPGVTAFALVRTPEKGHIPPDEKSTLFALTGSPANEIHGTKVTVCPPNIEDAIERNELIQEESAIKFDDLFAALDGKPVEKEMIHEEQLQGSSSSVEEAVPELISDRIPHADDNYSTLIKEQIIEGEQSWPAVDEGYAGHDTSPIEEAVPALMIPDTIPYSDDDDSTSSSSSDTSGTYILDNDDVEEDPREYHKSLLQEAIPEEESSYPPVTTSQRSYDKYVPPPLEEQYEEPVEEEEPAEEEEKPKSGRMFFLTSAMLAQLSQQQNQDSHVSDDIQQSRNRPESASSDSSDSYLEEFPEGYGPNSGRVWPQDPDVVAYERLPEEAVAPHSYVQPAPSEDEESEGPLRFRPIPGQDTSAQPTEQFAVPVVPTKVESGQIMPKQPPTENPLSDYDSSSELIEIENQKQKMFPFYTDPQSSSWSQQQNPCDKGHYSGDFLPCTEPTVTISAHVPEELAPTRYKEGIQTPTENTENIETVRNLSKLAPEPAIAKDLHVPEEFAPTLDKMQPTEKPEQFREQDPSKYVTQYPFSQREEGVLSASDYRGYEGSSSGDSGDEHDVDPESTSRERLFAIVGKPTKSFYPAVRVVGSIEVYRSEEEMDVQQSLYSYEISKGVAGPDGSITQLKEQTFTFEHRTDYDRNTEIDGPNGTITKIQEHKEQSVFYEQTNDMLESFRYRVSDEVVADGGVADEMSNSKVIESAEGNYHDNVDDRWGEPLHAQATTKPRHAPNDMSEIDGSADQALNSSGLEGADSTDEEQSGGAYAIGCYPAAEPSYVESQFAAHGNQVPEREDFEHQIDFLSDIRTEKTRELQRFKDDYPWLDWLIANPKETQQGYEEGEIVGLIAVYRQLEEELLDLTNAYKEAKTQLSQYDNLARR